MRCANAEVSPKTEGKMWIRLAVEPHLLRSVKNGLVLIGGSPAERDPPPRRNYRPVNRRFNRAHPANVRQWSDGAKEFFAGMNDSLRVFTEELKGFRMTTKIRQNRGDTVDDGVASPSKCQVGKSHHLVT